MSALHQVKLRQGVEWHKRSKSWASCVKKNLCQGQHAHELRSIFRHALQSGNDDMRRDQELEIELIRRFLGRAVSELVMLK